MEKAPAKINLALDVLYKREDQYHEVEMVMTTVDLADRIELEEIKNNDIRIFSQNRYVPDDDRNLAYQAASLLKRRFDIKQGVGIKIEKNIPVAAGLADIGSKIGSDVSFCVYGGTALATGRGEKITHLPSPPKCWVVLAKPIMGVSTADIYKRLDLENLSHPDIHSMLTAIETNDYKKVCQNVGNVLENVTLSLYPEVCNIKKQMKKFGADAVLMSGSGPTVFGLVEYDSRMHRVYNGLRGFCEQVHAVRLLGEQSTLE
jgi:4-diphosphocytidyl-2-C-methyl-D-erythritol kinase